MRLLIILLISSNLFAYAHNLKCSVANKIEVGVPQVHTNIKEQEKIACQLIRAHKQASIIYNTDTDISDKQALTLARKVLKAAKKHHVPANIFTAITFQESKFTMGLNNKTTGYRHPSKIEVDYIYIDCMDKQDIAIDTEAHKIAQNKCNELSNKLIQDKVYTDLGVTQIFQSSVRNYDFNPDRLLTDIDYALDCGAIVLKDFYRMYGKKELDWYSRYNASDTQKRMEYKNKVDRWL